MKRFTSAIRQCLAEENWYAAPYLSLAMPDTCAKLEDPDAPRAGSRYMAWFDRYLSSLNKMTVLGHESTFMTASDCWALRYSVLHEGKDDDGEQRSRATVARFQFTTLGSHRCKINDVLVLNIGRFCEEICVAVEQWAENTRSIPGIQSRIANMVAVHTSTFSPTPGVRSA